MLFANKKVYDDAAEYFEEMKKETEEKRAEREEVWAEKELSEKEKEEAAELRWVNAPIMLYLYIYKVVISVCILVS